MGRRSEASLSPSLPPIRRCGSLKKLEGILGTEHTEATGASVRPSVRGEVSLRKADVILGREIPITSYTGLPAWLH